MGDRDLAVHYSNWVRQNFVKVSKMFGMGFNLLEQRVLSLLAELEIKFVKAEKEKKKGKRSGIKKGEGGSRGLKRLEWSLNYEGKKAGREGKGSFLMN